MADLYNVIITTLIASGRQRITKEVTPVRNSAW